MREARIRIEDENDATGALEVIDEALSLRPDDVDLLHRKGEVLTLARRDQEALEVLTTALELDREDWDSYRMLMKVWGRLDMCDTAIAEVEDYLERHPSWGKAYYARGFCHYKEHRWDEALADVRRACELGHQPGCEMVESYGKPAEVLSIERVAVPE